MLAYSCRPGCAPSSRRILSERQLAAAPGVAVLILTLPFAATISRSFTLRIRGFGPGL